MEKFTKIKKNEFKKDDIDKQLKKDDLSIIEFDDKNIIVSDNEVVILPYFKDDGFILLKHEKCPAFKFKYKDKSEYNTIDYYLTSIKDSFNDKETETQNVRRILYEKTGVVLNQLFSIEVDKILFKDVNNVGQYHICLLVINYNDYKQTSLKTTEENKIVKVNFGDIDELNVFDIVTDYLILKLKYENNIK